MSIRKLIEDRFMAIALALMIMGGLMWIIGIVGVAVVGTTDSDNRMSNDHPCIVALNHSEEVVLASIESMRISQESIRQLMQRDYDAVHTGSDELRRLSARLAEISDEYDINREECMSGID